jgi:ATP-binding protein involved in chromosome partitioning
MTAPSNEQLTRLVEKVRDPHFGRPLSDLQAVASVRQEGATIRVELALPSPGYPGSEQLVAETTRAIQSAAPDARVEVKVGIDIRGKNTGGSVGLRVKNVIAVGSGKGGVGKSTIAAALALGLKHYGANVGLLDADVYGPSIPHLVGASGQPEIRQQQHEGQVYERLVPIEVDGLKLMSIGFMVKKDQAVIWRGPMLHKALTQFLRQTEWGDLDYLVIDMPPGTGDVALTLSQMMSITGAVVVCTPQKVALLDAVKAITMMRTVNIPILGLVENMSGELFGRGGAKARAAELGIPFLGEVPSHPVIRERGDEGQMASLFRDDNPAKEALLNVCSQTALQVVRQLLDAPKGPTLEIL